MGKKLKKFVKRPAPVFELDQYDPQEADMPIGDLVPDKANPKLHGKKNLEAVEKSLREYGQLERLIVQRGTGVVVGGNARLDRMKHLRTKGDVRFDTVKVVLLTLTEAQRRRLSVELNRTSELGEFDDKILAGILAESAGDGKEVAGFDQTDIDRIIEDVNAEKVVATGGNPDFDRALFDEATINKLREEAAKADQRKKAREAAGESNGGEDHDDSADPADEDEDEQPDEAGQSLPETPTTAIKPRVCGECGRPI